MSEPTRRRVTYAQLEQLWEFLNKNRGIATGYNKTCHAREYSKRMWEEITTSLNSQGDGAFKDWKGWCKYWNDYKSKLKKTVATIRESNKRTGGGQSTTRTLSEIEKKYLQILGEDYGLGLPGIRVEPFEMVQEAAETESMPSESLLTGLEMVVVPTEDASMPQPGPSWRITPPLPPSPSSNIEVVPPNQPTSTPPMTPSGSGRRQALPPSPPAPPENRRRQRRERPMTAEIARRNLLAESQRLTEIAAERNKIMKAILDELRQIKAILRSKE